MLKLNLPGFVAWWEISFRLHSAAGGQSCIHQLYPGIWSSHCSGQEQSVSSPPSLLPTLQGTVLARIATLASSLVLSSVICYVRSQSATQSINILFALLEIVKQIVSTWIANGWLRMNYKKHQSSMVGHHPCLFEWSGVAQCEYQEDAHRHSGHFFWNPINIEEIQLQAFFSLGYKTDACASRCAMHSYWRRSTQL